MEGGGNTAPSHSLEHATVQYVGFPAGVSKGQRPGGGISAPGVMEKRTGLSRWLESTALIFLGRHAGRAMKRARKAGLRGELRIERYLR
jgi:hypothetical protein